MPFENDGGDSSAVENTNDSSSSQETESQQGAGETDGGGEEDPNKYVEDGIDFRDIMENEDLFERQKEELKAQRKAKVAKDKAKAEAEAAKAKPKDDSALSLEEEEEDKDKAKSSSQEIPDDTVFEHTIDGEKVKLTLKELKEGYGLKAVSNKRMAEAAQSRKQSEAVLKLLGEGPAGVAHLLNTVHDNPEAAYQIAEEILSHKLKLLSMSKVERENYELKLQLDAREKALKEKLDAEKKQEVGVLQAQYETHFKSAMSNLAKTSGLPDSKVSQDIIKRAVVGTIKLAMEKGKDPVAVLGDGSRLVNWVRGEYERQRKELLDVAPEDLIKEKGPEFEKKMREYFNKKYTSTGGKLPPNPKDVANKPAKKSNKPKFSSWEEWSAKFDEENQEE